MHVHSLYCLIRRNLSISDTNELELTPLEKELEEVDLGGR